MAKTVETVSGSGDWLKPENYGTSVRTTVAWRNVAENFATRNDLEEDNTVATITDAYVQQVRDGALMNIVVLLKVDAIPDREIYLDRSKWMPLVARYGPDVRGWVGNQVKLRK